jgi:hypothetical protein
MISIKQLRVPDSSLALISCRTLAETDQTISMTLDESFETEDVTEV